MVLWGPPSPPLVLVSWLSLRPDFCQAPGGADASKPGLLSRWEGRAVARGRGGPPSSPVSLGSSVTLPSPLLHLWVEVSGCWCQRLCAGASRFCFTRWLLATCFLHSAHSVSHFTLPQAKRSIHLVQTLLTGLGRGRPLLGPTRGVYRGLLSGDTSGDSSPGPGTHPNRFLALQSPRGAGDCLVPSSFLPPPSSALSADPLRTRWAGQHPNTS